MSLLDALFGSVSMDSGFSYEPKRFSRYLPYKSGDFKESPDEIGSYSNLYLLKDNSVLRVYECSPMVLSSNQSLTTLTSIIKLRFPINTIIQVTLLSDDYLDGILNHYKSLRENSSEQIFKEQTVKLSAFLKAGNNGMPQFADNPIRNFRLFISIKIPMKASPLKEEQWNKEQKEYLNVLRDVESSLTGMNVSPKLLDPKGLINLLYGVLNPDLPRDSKPWDTTQPIDRQVIYADTPIKLGEDYLELGKTYCACMTPKTYPGEVDFFFANSIIGLMNGSKSNEDDSRQIRSKFIYTLNIIKSDMNTKLTLKRKQAYRQGLASGFSPAIRSRIEEYRWSEEVTEKGEEFVQIIPIMLLFNKDKDTLDTLVSDVKSMWKSIGMESQREQDYLLPKLLISALPGGLYGKDLSQLHRDWIVTATAASRFATLNGGFNGIGKPNLLFVDRKGQLTQFDFFSTANNKNILITGGSGGGKSFLMNYIVSSYYSCGYRIRIIDVGESYAKLTYMVDGTYIYPLREHIVVNFFETLKLPNFETDNLTEEEAEAVMGSLAMLTSIVSTMAYSRTGGTANEHEKVLIELAIKESYAKKQQSMQIDDIADFLDNITDYYKAKSNGNYTIEKYTQSIQYAHFLSESLQNFTSKGQHGRFFNGKSNISLDNQLVVTELNNLPDDIKKVLVLAVASIISDQVYRGDNTPTLIYLDEAWQTLSENQAAADFVEGLYRKIRKHNGGVGIITQSIADLDANQGKLKYLGNVLKSQSAYHFIILDQYFNEAVQNGVLSISEFEHNFYYNRMPEAKAIGYKYSEIFIRNSSMSAVVRLIVDPYTYLINTSDADERDYIVHLTNSYQKQGYSKRESLVKAISDCEALANKLGGISYFSEFVKREMTKIRNKS